VVKLGALKLGALKLHPTPTAVPPAAGARRVVVAQVAVDSKA